MLAPPNQIAPRLLIFLILAHFTANFVEPSISDFSIVYVKFEPQLHRQSEVLYPNPESALKYNLQIAIALPEYVQPSAEDVIHYCWDNDISIIQSITNFLKNHLDIQVTFMSFLVEDCYRVSQIRQFYPFELLTASVSSQIHVETEDGSSTAGEDVASSAQSILIGEYINSQFSKQSPIHVNRLPEMMHRQKESLIGRYKRQTSLTAANIKLIFRIHANLNQSWNADYRNCNSSLFRETARHFCLLHRAALRRHANNTSIWTQCTVTNYLPIEVQLMPNSSQRSNFLRVSADFRTNHTQLFGETSTQTTAIMNQAFRLIENDEGFNIILPTQVIRTDEFLTCAKDASICSRFATCVQTSRGFNCICSTLFKDHNPEVPGTNCQLDVQAMVIISIVVSLVVFSLTLTVWATTIRQRHHAIVFHDEE